MKKMANFFKGLVERFTDLAAGFLVAAIIAALGYFIALFLYGINYLLKSEKNVKRIN